MSMSMLMSMPAGAGSGGPTHPPGTDALGISTNLGKWDNGQVFWVYNASDAPGGFTNDVEVLGWLQDALESWQGTCGVTFFSAGIDNSADIDDMTDGVVVFEWDAGIGSAAGLAGPFFSTPPATLTAKGFHPYLDGTLRLNPLVFELTGAESPAQVANNFRAFTDTVLHEVGHLIGLGHSDEPKSRMYANPYNSLPALRADDIDGCRSMYGFPNLSFAQTEFSVPPAGANPFNSLILSAASAPTVPVTSITDLTDGTLVVRYSVNGPFAESVMAVATDPEGFDAAYGGAQINCDMGFICSGFFSFSTYDRMREHDGTWDVHVLVDGETVQSLEIAVADLLPTINNVPAATFSFSDNPATREVSATLDVTADVEGNTAILTWHVPTLGPQTPVNISVYPDSDSVNVNLADSATHEVFVELSDNSARYTEDPPNLVGPAGEGFNKLYRYLSSGLNIGPDYDGDNTSDILLLNENSGQLYFWQIHGNLISGGGSVTVLGDLNWRVISDGDFNGDGKSDLMWRHDVTGEVYYWSMNGRTIVTGSSVVKPADTNWRVVGDGDYDGDGRADLLWRHTIDGRVHLWTMNGSTIASSAIVARVSDLLWQVVGNDDSDGDGIADITWMHPGTGQVYFWKMNGSAIVSGGQVAIVSDLNWQVVSDGDNEGDGRADLLWRHAITGKVYQWRMNGQDILSSARVSFVTDLNWNVVGSGDYNGDGTSDVLWRHAVTNEVYHWQQISWITLRAARIAVLENAAWNVVNSR